MIKKILSTIVTLAIIFTFSACNGSGLEKVDETNDETEVQEKQIPDVPDEILEDLVVDLNDMTERELALTENLNDVFLRDFTLPDFDGAEHSLSDYLGEIIILNFWAIGCPPCVNELPDFNEVAKREGVVLVTVAQKNILGNEKTESGEFISQFETVALWDEANSTSSVYPSQYYPHTYIIDRSGTIRFVLNSASYELLDELVSYCDEMFD